MPQLWQLSLGMHESFSKVPHVKFHQKYYCKRYSCYSSMKPCSYNSDTFNPQLHLKFCDTLKHPVHLKTSNALYSPGAFKKTSGACSL
jgi:hypothetical protein